MEQPSVGGWIQPLTPLIVPASIFFWLLPPTFILLLTTPQSKWLPAPMPLKLLGSPFFPSGHPFSLVQVAQFYSFLLGLVLGCKRSHYRGHFTDTGPPGTEPAGHLTAFPVGVQSFLSDRSYSVGPAEAELGFQPRDAVSCSFLNPDIVNY